jgi:hypothetical protein
MTKKIYRTKRSTRTTPKNMNYNSRNALSRLKMASASNLIYTRIKEAFQTTSMSSRSFSRSFSKALPVSSSFQSFLRTFRRFYRLPDDSTSFRKVLWASRRFFKVPEGSSRFQKVLRASRRFWNTITKYVCDITSSSSDEFHKEHENQCFYISKNSIICWRIVATKTTHWSLGNG